MQHVAVDVVGPEVLERAGERLRDLRGEIGRGIVGQAVVLAVPVGELGLQEEVAARDHARAIGGGEPLTDAGLEVVPALVGGVDAAEARPERQLGQRRGAVFLPGGAVEEVGDHPALAALGATETPRAPVFSIARATSPDAFASSTTRRR